ncbi:PREDICTED: granulocyte-macrophage colony-stimulating factor receptor subunit alpha isoform X2 [Chinchilla lanigera]|uniref:granulocyte-macrophage colony-stimulating factor receptor subunit alpha isoform X2 n=1 Tax=Chinchilla lanigera TaxID=34839 RepID=UPI00038ED7CE|nr:PREDICTED: granulocyte-macrophage colony-stimulating factor receptor subunit alpha isoform X2 [Chinchilla lanigera]
MTEPRGLPGPARRPARSTLPTRRMGRRLQLPGPRVATVSQLLGLWILLSVARSSGQSSLGPARDARSPITKLQLRPRQKTLTWECASPVGSAACRLDAPLSAPVSTTPRALDKDTYFCYFPNSVLHRGATFTVYAVVANSTFQETLHFHNPGRVGAGATNLSCVIYDVHSMNCSWAPGPEAPGDTRYQLFLWFNPRHDESECAHYLLDTKRMRVGCHFAQLPGEPKTTDNYFFLINGTSSEAAIPFLDTVPFVPFLNEKYSPPANVTVSPAGLGFVVRWDEPVRRFQQNRGTLYYELDIRRKGGVANSQSVLQRGHAQNRYPLPEGAAGSSVRLRVRHLRGTIWSEWSAAVPFGPRWGSGCSRPCRR